MTRKEHLEWCKQRALAYCDIGESNTAWMSMVSDMKKHPETADHAALKLGSMLLFGGHNSNPRAMRQFIEGFN